MILEIVLLAAIILNLAAVSICAFLKKKNLLIFLAIVEALLAILFAVIVTGNV